MKRLIALAAAFLALSGIVYLWHIKPAETPAPGAREEAPKPLATATSGQARPSSPQSPRPPSPPSILSPKLRSYLQEEKGLLEARGVDASQAEARAQAMAAEMGEAEVSYLADIVLSPETSGSERILAGYLLSKSDPRRPGVADAIRKSFAFQPPPAPPHSPEEIANMQAKAMNLTILEELAKRARTDVFSRGLLHELLASTADPTLKKLIAQKIQELSPR